MISYEDRQKFEQALKKLYYFKTPAKEFDILINENGFNECNKRYKITWAKFYIPFNSGLTSRQHVFITQNRGRSHDMSLRLIDEEENFKIKNNLIKADYYITTLERLVKSFKYEISKLYSTYKPFTYDDYECNVEIWINDDDIYKTVREYRDKCPYILITDHWEYDKFRLIKKHE